MLSNSTRGSVKGPRCALSSTAASSARSPPSGPRPAPAKRYRDPGQTQSRPGPGPMSR
nr:MAG TPA: hypothetical protein [Caudoviricetes sp.]